MYVCIKQFSLLNMQIVNFLMFHVAYACTRNSIFFTDCGAKYFLPNGEAQFTGSKTTFNQTVHVICSSGFIIIGDKYINCLSDGRWSNNTFCVAGRLFLDICTHSSKIDFPILTTWTSQLPIIRLSISIGNYLSSQCKNRLPMTIK